MVKFEKPKTVDEVLALIETHLPGWEWLSRNGPKAHGAYLGNVLTPDYPRAYKGVAARFPRFAETKVDALWNAFVEAHAFAVSNGLIDDTRH